MGGFFKSLFSEEEMTKSFLMTLGGAAVGVYLLGHRSAMPYAYVLGGAFLGHTVSHFIMSKTAPGGTAE